MARICLTAKEGKVLDALVSAAEDCQSKSVLRVAGGWVRDKLLGLRSADLDIAVDNMTGKQFAELVAPFLKRIDPGFRFKPVESNSQHLGTTKLVLWGQDIDVVNLRSETYSEHSRIPTSMKFGTPEEDADRRDLTINSLFYNAATREVEDFTGRGVADLRAGIIRTPLPARVTFLDDPLRVLRSIRFAARFDFELDEELESGASSECVKLAFATKIARARMHKEVQGMLFGPHPVKAVHLLHKLGYLRLVLKPPRDEEWESSVIRSLESVCGALDSIESVDEEERQLILVAGLLLPFKEDGDTVLGTLLECLGLKGRMLRKVGHSIPKLINLTAVQVGSLFNLLRNPCFGEWFGRNEDHLVRGGACPFQGEFRVGAGVAFKRHQCCLTAFSLLLSLQVCTVWHTLIFDAILRSTILSGLLHLKQLLSGDDIKNAFNVSGAQVGALKDKSLVWQLENPMGGKAECIEWLSQWHGLKRQKTC